MFVNSTFADAQFFKFGFETQARALFVQKRRRQLQIEVENLAVDAVQALFEQSARFAPFGFDPARVLDRIAAQHLTPAP